MPLVQMREMLCTKMHRLAELVTLQNHPTDITAELQQ